MTRNVQLTFLSVLFLMGCPKLGTAALSKIGSEIRSIRTPVSTGILFGWRYLHHRSDLFSIGGAAYTGQLSSGAQGSFSYGGLVAAYNTDIAGSSGLEISLMGGGAGGFTNAGAVAGGIALEPNFSISFALGRYVRTCVSVGYVWMPNFHNFSGYTAGLRFDFLSDDAEPHRS